MATTAADQQRPTQAAVYWTGGDSRWKLPDDLAVLTETVRADVCIVGGGFTGLWTALCLKAAAARHRRRPHRAALLRRRCVGTQRRLGQRLGRVVPRLVARFGADVGALARRRVGQGGLGDR